MVPMRICEMHFKAKSTTDILQLDVVSCRSVACDPGVGGANTVSKRT